MCLRWGWEEFRSGCSLVRTGIDARHYTTIGVALHVFTYLQLLCLYVHSGKLVLHVALGSGACNDTVSCIHLWLSNSLTVQGYPCSNCTRVCKLMCSSILLAIRYLNYVLWCTDVARSRRMQCTCKNIEAVNCNATGARQAVLCSVSN